MVRSATKTARDLASIVLAVFSLAACCPPFCVAPDPPDPGNSNPVDPNASNCHESRMHTQVDNIFEVVDDSRVMHPDLSYNQENFFRLYMHGDNPTTLNDNPNNAKGIAFRVQLMDGQDIGQQWSSNFFLTFVMEYRIPSRDCEVDLHWEVNPSVYLANGVEIVSDQSNSSPMVNFKLHIVEDPTGQYDANTFPQDVLDNSTVGEQGYGQTQTNGLSVFPDKIDGIFHVSSGDAAKLFVILGVWVQADKAHDTVCIGCIGPPAQRNSRLMDSAFFTVFQGPFWYTEPVN